MNIIIAYLIGLLLYPGIFFALLAGWLLLWLREAVAARQRGAPTFRLRQPLQDTRKLFKKEADATAGTEAIARFLPRLAALSPVLALVLLPIPGNPAYSTATTTGDLLAVTFLLLLPALTPFFLGTLGASPYGRIAAQRALPRLIGVMGVLLLSMLAVAAQRGSLDLDVLVAPQTHPTLASIMLDVIAGLLFCLCLPALLPIRQEGIFRSDLELIAGAYTDLAGADLALLRLGAAMQQVAASSLLAVLFILPYVPGGTAGQVIVYLAALLVSALLVGAARGSGRYSLAR